MSMPILPISLSNAETNTFSKYLIQEMASIEWELENSKPKADRRHELNRCHKALDRTYSWLNFESTGRTLHERIADWLEKQGEHSAADKLRATAEFQSMVRNMAND